MNALIPQVAGLKLCSVDRLSPALDCTVAEVVKF